MINDVILNRLRDEARAQLDEKRYAHTASVEREVAELGRIFLPDGVYRLRAAALLHDITKQIPWERQLRLAEEFGIEVESDPRMYSKIIHGKTAAAYARLKFPEVIDAEIASAIEKHTTGAPRMTVFETVLYLADVIEPTREYDALIRLRNYYISGMASAHSDIERFTVLISTVIRSLDSTVCHLIEMQSMIHPDTLAARNYFIDLLSRTAE